MKPEFLKKLDNYLLTNFPVIWQSKIIWVACYSLTLFTLFYFFGDRFDYEPFEHGEYNYSYKERSDRMIFGAIPLFLSILMSFYWLYTQYQQKIDYSKLSLVGFTGTVLLNFVCIALIFLPVLGLTYSTLDFGRQLEESWENVQMILTVAVAFAMLPFILRQYKIIETVLVLFFGVVYCIGVAFVFAGLLEVKGENELVAIFMLNYFAFLGYVLYNFANRTITQNIKRLALLCMLALPFVLPALVYYTGSYHYFNGYHRYYSLERSYEFAFGFKGHPFNMQWLVFNIGGALTTYSLLAYFMYRAMVFPVKRK